MSSYIRNYDSLYVTYLQNSYNSHEKSQINDQLVKQYQSVQSHPSTTQNGKKRVSQQFQERSLVYIPPDQRNRSLNTHQSSKRSKSYEHDLSKKQNTFGFQDSQSKIPKKPPTQEQQGFISPKFKVGIEETETKSGLENSQFQESILKTEPLAINADISCVSEVSFLSQASQKAREDQITLLQRAFDAKVRQNDILRTQNDSLKQQNEALQEQIRQLSTRNNELIAEKERVKQNGKKDLESSKENQEQNSMKFYEQENQRLKAIIDRLQYRIRTLEMNDSSMATRSVDFNLIERSKLNETGVELEKTFKEENSQYDIQKSKDQLKFIKCLKELVISCAPKNYFHLNEPSLKEIWKFIKQVLQSYLEMKKTIQGGQVQKKKKNYTIEQDIITRLTKYLGCKQDDICHRIACVVVDNEVLMRISDKVKILLKLPYVNNLREIDRQFDQFMNK